VSDDPSRPIPANGAGTPSDGLESLAEEVVPALIARLRASRLAELEVRTEGWRIRLRRDATAVRGRDGSDAAADTGAPGLDVQAGAARSPAVGYFTPAADLVLGRAVQAGDSLGSVDVLGIAQDVTAPVDGIISAVLAEGGQAVEYGQTLAQVDPLDADLDAGSVAAGWVAEAVD
jgi:biotin carboxyl carrier protein